MTPRPTLYIIGAGGHGRVVLDAARAAGTFGGFVFLDADETLHGTEIMSVPVRAQHELPPPGPDVNVCVAIGLDNRLRLETLERLLLHGYDAPAVVHPRACVAPDVTPGQGAVVFALAAVNPGAVLGAGCIVNTGATVDHDCTLEPGVHISPGAHLSGAVSVGACAHLGTGCAVRQGIRIGADAVIGVGGAVVSDIPAGAMATGVPARPSGSSGRETP